MKPNLKPPGTNRLELRCDIPISNYAFEFNLRRCSLERIDELMRSSLMLVTALNQHIGMARFLTVDYPTVSSLTPSRRSLTPPLQPLPL
jgi:hypothetical protein